MQRREEQRKAEVEAALKKKSQVEDDEDDSYSEDEFEQEAREEQERKDRERREHEERRRQEADEMKKKQAAAPSVKPQILRKYTKAFNTWASGGTLSSEDVESLLKSLPGKLRFASVTDSAKERIMSAMGASPEALDEAGGAVDISEQAFLRHLNH